MDQAIGMSGSTISRKAAMDCISHFLISGLFFFTVNLPTLGYPACILVKRDKVSCIVHTIILALAPLRSLNVFVLEATKVKNSRPVTFAKHSATLKELKYSDKLHLRQLEKRRLHRLQQVNMTVLRRNSNTNNMAIIGCESSTQLACPNI